MTRGEVVDIQKAISAKLIGLSNNRKDRVEAFKTELGVLEDQIKKRNLSIPICLNQSSQKTHKQTMNTSALEIRPKSPIP